MPIKTMDCCVYSTLYWVDVKIEKLKLPEEIKKKLTERSVDYKWKYIM